MMVTSQFWRLMCAAVVILMSCSVARSDTVFLKNGDKLTGRVIELKDRVIVVTQYGAVAAPATEIAKIERDPAAPQENREIIEQLQKVLFEAERPEDRDRAVKELAALNDESVLPLLEAAACADEESSSVTYHAIDGIMKLAGAEKAAPYLLNIIWRARTTAALNRAIGELRKTQVENDALLKFCKELLSRADDKAALVNGAYAISQLGRDLGQLMLMNAALDDGADWSTRIRAVEMMRYPKDERIKEVLLKLAVDEQAERELRVKALKTLPRFGSEVPTDVLARLCLSTRDGDVQEMALDGMRYSTGEEEMKAYCEMAVGALKEETRRKAMYALTRTRRPEALETLCELLLDRNVDFASRQMVLQAVATYDAERATETLFELSSMEDEELELRLMAVGGLRSHRPEALNAAAALIAQGLATVGGTQAMSRVLQASCGQQHPMVAQGSAVVLRMIPKGDAAAAVRLAALEMLKDPSVASNRTAVAQLATVLCEMGDGEGGQFFAERMQGATDPRVKAALCRMIGGVGFLPAADILAHTAVDRGEEESIRQSAVEGLFELARHVVLKHLEESAKDLNTADQREEMAVTLDTARRCFSTSFLHATNVRNKKWIQKQVNDAREDLLNSKPFAAIIDVGTTSDSYAVQSGIVQFFRDLRSDDKRVNALYFELLDTSDDPKLLRSVVYALRSLDNPEIIPPLEKALRRNIDPDVRVQMIDILRSKKSRSSLDVLVKLLRDENEKVVSAALRALESTTGNNFGRYKKGKPHDNEKVIAAWEKWYKSTRAAQ